MALYAFTVLCVVYILRRKGVKLPKEEVRTRPYAGWLFLGADERVYFPQEAARLFKSEQDRADLIEPLIYPRVSINRGGILLRGSQEVRCNVTNAQAWWCVPGPLDDLTAPG